MENIECIFKASEGKKVCYTKLVGVDKPVIVLAGNYIKDSLEVGKPYLCKLQPMKQSADGYIATEAIPLMRRVNLVADDIGFLCTMALEHYCLRKNYKKVADTVFYNPKENDEYRIPLGICKKLHDAGIISKADAFDFEAGCKFVFHAHKKFVKKNLNAFHTFLQVSSNMDLYAVCESCSCLNLKTTATVCHECSGTTFSPLNIAYTQKYEEMLRKSKRMTTKQVDAHLIRVQPTAHFVNTKK